MDFFKSVFAEDPDPPSSGSKPESSSSSQQPTSDSDFDSDPNPPTPPSSAGDATAGGASVGGWSFGGLIKTLATRSESVVETYRRDLQEFRSGLKKETATFREAARRAVKELPSSIDSSTSKAQVAFNSIAEIIAQGKESLLAPDLDSESSDHGGGGGGNLSSQSMVSGRYSRFDAQLRAIQCDVNTYIEEPEDGDDYNKWKLGFDLGEKREEIEDLISENGAIGGIYKRVVPTSVDHEGFWCRYYYRVHRLQQAESVRANLVKRAISKEDEEELSWDVDDDDDEQEGNVSLKNVTDVPLEGNNLVTKDVGSEVSGKSVNEVSSDNVTEVRSSVVADQKGESSHNVVDEKKKDVVESVKLEVSNKEVSSEGASEAKYDESSKKPNLEVVPVARAEASESGKDSDVSMALKQSSPEEEDLSWDEIEDLGSDDDKKVSHSGVSSNRAQLTKRLSAADDEEDVSWDIEDDDEPIKS